MVNYELVAGKKSKSDRIIKVYSNGDAWSFKELAYCLALIVKNEQAISAEIPHYTRGSDLIKEYMMRIFKKNWIIVPNHRIEQELQILYNQKYTKKNPEESWKNTFRYK